MRINLSSFPNPRNIWSIINILGKNWVIKLTNISVVMLTATSLIIIGLSWNLIPEKVPLWYSNIWGPDRLAENWWLIILPILGLFWHLINVLVSALISREFLVFCQLLHLSSLLVNLLTFVSIINVILLIT